MKQFTENRKDVHDLDLSSEQIAINYPDMIYVRHGGRHTRVVHKKDGSRETVQDIIWNEEIITKVWVQCDDVTDGITSKMNYTLHLSYGRWSGKEDLVISLTYKQYKRLAEAKYTKPAFTLLIKILRKDGQGLLLRRQVATEKLSFRTTKRVAEKIINNSIKCGMSESAYIEKCCDQTTPRLALTEEEKILLQEFQNGRRDLQFAYNMLTIWRKGKTTEEIAHAFVMGENFVELRKHMRSVMEQADRVCEKRLNRQISQEP